MLTACAEDDDWLLDPELNRLRAEWIRAFQEWDFISSCAPGAVLTDDQRARLRRYHKAEAAYFARCRELPGR